MRSRSSPAGGRRTAWPCASGVWSTIHSASGLTISVRVTWYTKRPVGGRHDHLVAGDELVEVAERLCVADAVPGDHDVADLAGHRRAGPVAGAVVERRERMPSYIVVSTPIFGISIEPTSTTGSVVPSLGRRRRSGSAASTATVGAAVVVDVVVDVVVVVGVDGAWSAARSTWSASSSVERSAVVVGDRRRRRPAPARRRRRRRTRASTSTPASEHDAGAAAHRRQSASAVTRVRPSRRQWLGDEPRRPRAAPGRCTPGCRCRRSWRRPRTSAGGQRGARPRRATARWCGPVLRERPRPADDARRGRLQVERRGGGRPRRRPRRRGVVVEVVGTGSPSRPSETRSDLAVAAAPVRPLLRPERHRRDEPLHRLRHEVAAAARAAARATSRRRRASRATTPAWSIAASRPASVRAARRRAAGRSARPGWRARRRRTRSSSTRQPSPSAAMIVTGVAGADRRRRRARRRRRRRRRRATPMPADGRVEHRAVGRRRGGAHGRGRRAAGCGRGRRARRAAAPSPG